MYELNSPQKDWVTITTFNPLAMAEMQHWHDSISDNTQEAKRMQYVGTSASDRYGTSFLGFAEQKEMRHCLMQVSGMLSASAFNASRAYLAAGTAKVRRIDLQVTVDYPRSTWSQRDLHQVLKREREDKVVSYFESKSGPQNTFLATVYFGSRTSERLIRIYEKRGLADDVHLRYEIEYKGRTAETVAALLIQGESVRGILWSELKRRLPDVYNLRRLFERSLSGNAVDVRTIKEPGNTAEWLKTSVIPALDRYLNEHETDSQAMASLIHRVVADHLP